MNTTTTVTDFDPTRYGSAYSINCEAVKAAARALHPASRLDWEHYSVVSPVGGAPEGYEDFQLSVTNWNCLSLRLNLATKELVALHPVTVYGCYGQK